MRFLLSALALVSVSFSLAATPARAQSAERTAHDDCSRARALGKTCVLTLEAADVEGGVVKPDGEVFSPRTFADGGSLIRLRRDFIPEILQSAEQLP